MDGPWTGCACPPPAHRACPPATQPSPTYPPAPARPAALPIDQFEKLLSKPPPAFGLRAALAGCGGRVKGLVRPAARRARTRPLDAARAPTASAVEQRKGVARPLLPRRMGQDPMRGSSPKGAGQARRARRGGQSAPSGGHLDPEGEPAKPGEPRQGCPSLGTRELDIGRNAKSLKIKDLRKGVRTPAVSGGADTSCVRGCPKS